MNNLPIRIFVKLEDAIYPSGGWLTLESLIHFFFLVRSLVAHDTTVVDHRVVTSGLGVGAAPFGL